MELKMYIPVHPKFVLQKIKFKVLYYIQFDFIHQCLGLSKDQTSNFKSLVINYLMVIQKNKKNVFFIKVGVANVLLKLNYL